MSLVGNVQRERVLLTCHPHVKVLTVPVMSLFGSAIIFGAGLGLMPRLLPPDRPDWVVLVWVALLIFALVLFVLMPFLRWRATTYALTNHRVAIRRGVVTRTGDDIPLSRINTVRHSRNLLDRVVGSGTLHLVPDLGRPLVLSDVPRVAQMHAAINDLLFLHRSGGSDHLRLGPS